MASGLWQCLALANAHAHVTAAAGQLVEVHGHSSNKQYQLLLRCAVPAEGQGKGRKLSIALVKQPAAAGQQRYVMWDSLLLATEDASKSPEKRDQAAKSG